MAVNSRLKQKKKRVVFLAKVTIMVNNEMPDLIPLSGDDPSDRERRIGGGPLYSLSKVQKIARVDTFLVTGRCRADVQKLGWSVDDIVDLVNDLTKKNYKNSEWCRVSNGAWLACDAYVIVKDVYYAHLYKTIPCEYYVKFAIGPTGKAILVVSCHF